MEIYELLRKHFAMCGVHISREAQNQNPVNMRNSVFFIVIILSAVSTAASINQTDEFYERTEMANQSFSYAVCGICYIIVVWKTSNLSEFLNNLTETIETSE